MRAIITRYQAERRRRVPAGRPSRAAGELAVRADDGNTS
jgi:hypothetical protein